MQIGRYRVDHELGRGAMGIVYLGFDPLLKRRVAVKTVLPGAATTEQPWDVLLKRLTREAQAAASLSHPHIMSVYDIVAEAEMFSIVMELVDGKSLTEAVPPGTIATAEFMMRILNDCASALDHAHSRGVIHRDIKPANIMLDASGAAKITDFGIAKFINATTELTRGFAVGTLEYMSPEQLNAQPVDGRSDQFSLAAVAYRMLTGARIYDADSVGAWCAMLVTQRPVAASGRNSGLPRAADAVLDRGMALAPEKRYASCSEFASELGRALTKPAVVQREIVEPAAEPRPKLDRPPDHPPDRRPRVLTGKKAVALGVVLAAVAGAVAFYLARRPSPGPPPPAHAQLVQEVSPTPKQEAPPAAKEIPAPAIAPAAGKEKEKIRSPKQDTVPVPAPKASTESAKAVASAILFSTDAAVRISIDGEDSGALGANSSWRFPVAPGSHVLVATSTEQPSLIQRKVVEVQKGGEPAVSVELARDLDQIRRQAAAERETALRRQVEGMWTFSGESDGRYSDGEHARYHLKQSVSVQFTGEGDGFRVVWNETLNITNVAASPLLDVVQSRPAAPAPRPNGYIRTYEATFRVQRTGDQLRGDAETAKMRVSLNNVWQDLSRVSFSGTILAGNQMQTKIVWQRDSNSQEMSSSGPTLQKQ